MATRSTIAMQQPDGSIMKIYCHWDGYLEHNGEILQQHYQDDAKILGLMLLGDLSSLRANLGEPHDFDGGSEENWCTAYGRDRGERDTHARVYRDFEHYREECQFEEFNYIWRSGQWFVEYYGEYDGPLAQALAEQQAMADQ